MNCIDKIRKFLKQKKCYYIIFFSLLFVLCPITSIAKKGSTSEKVESKKITNENIKNDRAVKDSSKKSDKVKSNVGERVGLPQKDYTENDFKPQVEEESYTWMVMKTLLILALLVGGFYYFFRFVTRKAGVQFLGQEVLQTLSILPLGQNKYLQVVDLAGQILVLGVTDNNINMIKEITEKEEIDRIRLLSSKSDMAFQKNFQEQIMTQVGKFVNKVNQIRDKNRVSSTDNDKIESGMDLTYLKNQKDRLKNLNGFGND